MPDGVRPEDAAPAQGDRAFWLTETGLADPTPVKALPPSRRERLEGDDLEQLIKLKRFYGRGILLLMGLQLVVVNTVFVIYARSGYDWHPPDGVVQVWLTATFVQIVSVVVVITRSLFPGEKPGG
ncbi:MAG: hypothetical protein ABW196_03650 [Solirubrobacterales bacterium]